MKSRVFLGPSSWVVLLVAFAVTACGKTESPAVSTDSAVASEPSPEEALMAKGLEQMNTAGDAAGAVTVFRELLSRNPAHYGATFQLAKALDKVGQPDSARVWWTKFATLAEAVPDTLNTAIARARLALPDTVSQEAMMGVGLSLMNAQNNPTAAAEQFRVVLKRNPTHYGATYQLAQALDKAGKAVEARQVWTKVLAMAEAIKDQPSIDIAKARLKQNP